MSMWFRMWKFEYW